MTIKCKECYPHCDYCIHADAIIVEVNGCKIRAGAKGCFKHPDDHHQSMARSLNYCKDFYCYKVDEKEG